MEDESDHILQLETVIAKQEIEIDTLVEQLGEALNKVDALDEFRFIVYELLDAYTIIIVPLEHEKQAPAKKWLRENIQGNYYVFPDNEYAFEHMSEAVRFKITWGGQ